MCLLHLQESSSQDFARYHPGGYLGKQLYMRASDLTSLNEKPVVTPDTDLKTVIVEITEKMLGVTAVVENDAIVGIITDGDLRRMLTRSENFLDLTAKDIMTKDPKTIDNNAMAG